MHGGTLDPSDTGRFFTIAGWPMTRWMTEQTTKDVNHYKPVRHRCSGSLRACRMRKRSMRESSMSSMASVQGRVKRPSDEAHVEQHRWRLRAGRSYSPIGVVANEVCPVGVTGRYRGSVRIDNVFTRSLTHVARLAVVLGIPALLLADAVPIDPYGAPSDPDLEVLSSRAQTLRFQGGVALAVAAAWLLLVRAWRFGALALCLVAWSVLPAVSWSGADRAPIQDAPSLRLLSLNLASTYGDPVRVVDEIERADADVLVLQEYRQAWKETLEGAIGARYPHSAERPQSDNFGMAVFSRLPWNRMEPFAFKASHSPQFRCELDLGGTTLVLYSIHLIPPSRALYGVHREECAVLLRKLKSEGPHTIVIGDFNFVHHGPVGRAMVDLGFAEAHGMAGSGRGTTWPVHLWLHWTPGIRIDHVFLGPGLTSSHAWTGGLTGSDHRPVGCVVTLARD